MTTLLAIWVVARIALWQPPFALAANPEGDERPTLSRSAQFAQSDLRAAERSGESRQWKPTRADVPSASPLRPLRGNPLQSTASIGPPAAASALQVGEPDFRPVVGTRSALVPRAENLAFPALGIPLKTAKPFGRVSGEAWAMFRPSSSGAPFAGPLVGRYGASQAGAVVRYRLGRGNRRPSLYARTSAALDPLDDRELALGASARPLTAIPFRAQAELRARDAGRSVEFAPAALVVSEIQPVPLPLGLSAEPYVAAGYVGGRQATPFVDGMVRLHRPVAGAGNFDLRIGAGAWGGAQEGAAALDVGPTASMRSQVAGRQLTLALDYRLRLAGSAEPGSGLAVTLSAGF